MECDCAWCVNIIVTGKTGNICLEKLESVECNVTNDNLCYYFNYTGHRSWSWWYQTSVFPLPGWVSVNAIPQGVPTRIHV